MNKYLLRLFLLLVVIITLCAVTSAVGQETYPIRPTSSVPYVPYVYPLISTATCEQYPEHIACSSSYNTEPIPTRAPVTPPVGTPFCFANPEHEFCVKPTATVTEAPVYTEPSYPYPPVDVTPYPTYDPYPAPSTAQEKPQTLWEWFVTNVLAPLGNPKGR